MNLLTTRWDPMDKLKEEVASIGGQSMLDHCELLSLESKKTKNLQTHTEILTLREFLKAQVRNFPDIVKSFPMLQEYKA